MNTGTPSDDAILTRFGPRPPERAVPPGRLSRMLHGRCRRLQVRHLPPLQGGLRRRLLIANRSTGTLSACAYRFPQPLVSIGSQRNSRRTVQKALAFPPYVPGPVDALFRQARRRLVLRNCNAAGTTYRKALEVAQWTEFGFWRKSLASLVEAVSKSQPSILKFFARLTRVAGNEAAHAAEFSEAVYRCWSRSSGCVIGPIQRRCPPLLSAIQRQLYPLLRHLFFQLPVGEGFRPTRP